MRILFVMTDADIGGAERLLASLGRAWDPADTLRLVVIMGPGTMSEELERSFGSVRHLGYSASSRNVLGMVHALEREIRDFTPDVVASNLFHADLVTALARTTAIKTTTAHTQRLTKADHILTRLIARAVGLLSFRFAAVIPSSDSESMTSFLRRLRMRNVATPILNGAEVPPSPAFDPASRTLVSMARNHPVKGHDVLVAAFARIADEAPDWVLHAHGPDVLPDDERMCSIVAACGADALVASGRIVFGGPTAHPEKALGAAAALIISSKYGETLPIVGAEAAGLGIPVISTDVGSCSSFVDDDRFLVAPGDVDALAEALRDYTRLTDAERLRLSGLARERAETRYHPAGVAVRYRELFSTLLSDRRTT